MNVFHLHPGSRIYLDANIYIYGFEGIVEQRGVIIALFEEIQRKQVAIIASLLLFPELLAKPLALDALSARDRGFQLDVTTFNWGSDRYKRTGALMPADGAEMLK